MIRFLATLTLVLTMSSCSTLVLRLKDEPESHHRANALELLAQDPVEDARYVESVGVKAIIGGFGGVILFIGLENQKDAYSLRYELLRNVKTSDQRITHLQMLLMDPDGFPVYPFNDISSTRELYHEARVKYATLFNRETERLAKTNKYEQVDGGNQIQR